LVRRPKARKSDPLAIEHGRIDVDVELADVLDDVGPVQLLGALALLRKKGFVLVAAQMGNACPNGVIALQALQPPLPDGNPALRSASRG
jgi:hypothetical protein